MVAYPKLHIDPSDLASQVEEAYSAQTGIVANPGGGQANGVLLTRSFNRISTVATAGDSVKLPPALAGADMVVTNRGAASSNVFPSTGNSIGTAAVNAAYALAAGRSVRFVCIADGVWETMLGAAS